MKMKKLILFVIIILAVLSSYSQTERENVNKNEMNAMNAYTYIYGQELVLERIIKELPEYEFKIIIAQNSFNLAFGEVKKNIVTYLNEKMLNKKIEFIQNLAKKNLDSLYEKFEINSEFAEAYLKDVDARTKGIIPSPIFETILYFQYMNRPHLEFIGGFTQTFKTKSHAKSKNTDWQIKVPLSWKATEASRPNIIQNFSSDFFEGKRMISLAVKNLELKKGETFSEKEINEYFSENNAKNMIGSGSSLVSFVKMTFDGNKGCMLIYEDILERLDSKIKSQAVMFSFIYKANYYNVTCAVITLNLEEDLNIEMKKYLPLFKLVANSIVVNSKYKN